MESTKELLSGIQEKLDNKMHMLKEFDEQRALLKMRSKECAAEVRTLETQKQRLHEDGEIGKLLRAEYGENRPGLLNFVKKSVNHMKTCPCINKDKRQEASSNPEKPFNYGIAGKSGGGHKDRAKSFRHEVQSEQAKKSQYAIMVHGNEEYEEHDELPSDIEPVSTKHWKVVDSGSTGHALPKIKIKEQTKGEEKSVAKRTHKAFFDESKKCLGTCTSNSENDEDKLTPKRRKEGGTKPNRLSSGAERKTGLAKTAKSLEKLAAITYSANQLSRSAWTDSSSSHSGNSDLDSGRSHSGGI